MKGPDRTFTNLSKQKLNEQSSSVEIVVGGPQHLGNPY